MEWLVIGGLIVLWLYSKSRGASAPLPPASSGSLAGTATPSTSVYATLPPEVTPSSVAPGAAGFEKTGTTLLSTLPAALQKQLGLVTDAPLTGDLSTFAALSGVQSRSGTKTGGFAMGFQRNMAAAVGQAKALLPGYSYVSGNPTAAGTFTVIQSPAPSGNGYVYSVTFVSAVDAPTPNVFVAPSTAA